MFEQGRQFYNRVMDSALKPQDAEYEIPNEFPDLLRAGEEYSQLMSHPGWKRLIEDVQREKDRYLEALRECDSKDVIEARGSWFAAEELFKFLINRPKEAMDRRTTVINELKEHLADAQWDLGDDSMEQWARDHGLVAED